MWATPPRPSTGHVTLNTQNTCGKKILKRKSVLSTFEKNIHLALNYCLLHMRFLVYERYNKNTLVSSVNLTLTGCTCTLARDLTTGAVNVRAGWWLLPS